MMQNRMQKPAALVAASLALALACGSGGANAGMTVPTGGGRAPGVGNVRVSHDSYTAHAQSSLAVNPRDPRDLG